MEPEILFLKQEDVIKAGVLNMPAIMEQVEKCYEYMGLGQVVNPSKVMLRIPDQPNWNSFFMSMPSYIPPLDVAGFKWAAESHDNANHPGMPLGLDMTILSDPTSVYPRAIMDGTIITTMRTSAVAGMAAKYLARKDSKIATIVGAGVIGRTMIMAIMTALPKLEKIYLCDLNLEKAKALAAEFGGKYVIEASTDTNGCAAKSDLIVTATTTAKPFLKREAVKSNATVIQMSTWEIDKQIALDADNLYVDSWAQLTHIKDTLIQNLMLEHNYTENDVIHLQDVVTGNKPGRQNDDQLICCCTLGIGAIDIQVADWIYKKAKAMGIGTTLKLWDNPLWV